VNHHAKRREASVPAVKVSCDGGRARGMRAGLSKASPIKRRGRRQHRAKRWKALALVRHAKSVSACYS
jgi:hypothetical protein